MKMVRIGDVSVTVSKGTTPTSMGLSYSYSGIPFLRSEDVVGSAIDTDKVRMFIDEAAHKKLNRSALVCGDVLVTIAGTIGRVGFIRGTGQSANCNQAVAFIRPDLGRIDPEWLCFLLRSPVYQAGFSAFITGGAIPNVNLGQISSIEIPDIGISDQRRIAARLKAQLAEVEKARQAAETQLADAKYLMDVCLREAFDGKENNWPVCLLGDVGDVAAGVTLGGKPKGRELRAVPYMRVANVKDGRLDLSDVKTISVTEGEIEKWKLRAGDILFTEGGDLDKVGRGALWSGEIPECIHQNHIYRVRFPQADYLPEFVALQVRSKYAKDYFFSKAKKTTGIASINQQVLKGYPLLSPSIDVQKEVVSTLSSQLEEIQKITDGVQLQLAEINLLPQKILAGAFEGAEWS